MAAANATVARVVIPFRAGDLRAFAQRLVNVHGEQHAPNRRDEINPAGRPDAAGQRGRDRARGVDAHAGERRFEGDVAKHQRAAAESGEAPEPRRVRHEKHH